MVGIYTLNDFIFKKKWIKLTYSKTFLISSISLLSSKEKYDEYIFNIYLSYFFITGKYPTLTSVIFKKSENKKNRNKSVYLYLSSKYNLHNNIYNLLNTAFCNVIANAGLSKSASSMFIDESYVVNSNFILTRFKNLNFFIIQYLNALSSKLLNFNNVLINYKFYIVFDSSIAAGFKTKAKC